jgi:Protein of unknown function (DUF3224)
MPSATGEFEVLSWQEDSYEDRGDGAKLSRASVTQRFEGDITGDGAAEWLMAYRADGTARFVGLHRVDGQIGERRGSFVLETSGAFDGQTATWQAEVIDGSATDALKGLSGRGSFSAPLGNRATFELEYDFA